MAYFEWTSGIEVGHAEIDQQHKQLLLLAEAVVEPLMDSAEHQPGTLQLRELIAYAHKHFTFEEDLMRSTAYPGAEQHAKYHASLLAELGSYRIKVEQGQNANPAGLIAFLWNWLVLHILSGDRDLVAWLKSREADGG